MYSKEKLNAWPGLLHEVEQAIRVIEKNWNFEQATHRSNPEISPLRFITELAFVNGCDSVKEFVDVSKSSMSAKLSERMEWLKTQNIPSDMMMSDGTITMLFSSILHAEKVKPEFDNEGQIRELRSMVASHIKGSTNITPYNFDRENLHLLGLVEFKQDQLKQQIEDRKTFFGTDISSYSSKGFIYNTSLYSVMKDYQKGQSPHSSLIQNLFCQGQTIQLNQNLLELEHELKQIDSKSPFYNTPHENVGRWLERINHGKTRLIPKPLNKKQAQYLNPLIPNASLSLS